MSVKGVLIDFANGDLVDFKYQIRPYVNVYSITRLVRVTILTYFTLNVYVLNIHYTISFLHYCLIYTIYTNLYYCEENTIIYI